MGLPDREHASGTPQVSCGWLTSGSPHHRARPNRDVRYDPGVATPPEDERNAAWILQVALHDVVSAMLNDEVGESHVDPCSVARGARGACDRAEMLVTAVEPWFRGLHPALVAELHEGVACARAGAADQAMIHLFRVWEPLVVLAEAELDLPTRRNDEPRHG